MLFRAIVLAIAFCGSPASLLAADAGPGTVTTAFVSACRTGAEDQEFGSGVLLAFVHELGQRSTILFKATAGRVEPLADLHHATVDNPGFVEAQGGVGSTAVASDVVAFLRKRPFYLVGDWKAMMLDTHHFPQCEIKYVETGRYRASHVRRKK